MHTCLWGKYLNKLEKPLSQDLISLNLQYYSHSLLSYNDSQVIVYYNTQSLELLFWDNLSSFTKRNCKISLCCFISHYSRYIHLENDIFIRITFVDRLLSGGWKYWHANDSNTVTGKKDVKQKFSCCDVVWTLMFLFLSSSNFWEWLTPYSHSKNQ